MVGKQAGMIEMLLPREVERQLEADAGAWPWYPTLEEGRKGGAHDLLRELASESVKGGLIAHLVLQKRRHLRSANIAM